MSNVHTDSQCAGCFLPLVYYARSTWKKQILKTVFVKCKFGNYPTRTLLLFTVIAFLTGTRALQQQTNKQCNLLNLHAVLPLITLPRIELPWGWGKGKVCPRGQIASSRLMTTLKWLWSESSCCFILLRQLVSSLSKKPTTIKTNKQTNKQKTKKNIQKSLQFKVESSAKFIVDWTCTPESYCTVEEEGREEEE